MAARAPEFTQERVNLFRTFPPIHRTGTDASICLPNEGTIVTSHKPSSLSFSPDLQASLALHALNSSHRKCLHSAPDPTAFSKSLETSPSPRCPQSSKWPRLVYMHMHMHRHSPCPGPSLLPCHVSSLETIGSLLGFTPSLLPSICQHPHCRCLQAQRTLKMPKAPACPVSTLPITACRHLCSLCSGSTHQPTSPKHTDASSPGICPTQT